MLFSGIELPLTASVTEADIAVVEKFAGDYKETPQQFIEAAIGVVGTWGFIIDHHGYPTTFEHGVAEKDTLYAFDSIPNLIDARRGDLQGRKAEYKMLGIDFSIPALTVEIDPELAPYLQVASGYFDRDILPMIGIAVDLRLRVLEAQREGRIYLYSVNGGESWIDVEFESGLSATEDSNPEEN